LHFLDVPGNDDRPHLHQFANSANLAPLEELGDRLSVSSARVFVPDVRGEDSIKRQPALSPARRIAGGSASNPARERSRLDGIEQSGFSTVV